MPPPNQPDGPEGRRNWTTVAAEYTSLAFLLPASTFVGYLIGYLLDRWLGTHFLYIVFLIIGIIGGFLKLIQQLQRDMKSGRI